MKNLLNPIDADHRKQKENEPILTHSLLFILSFR